MGPTVRPPLTTHVLARSLTASPSQVASHSAHPRFGIVLRARKLHVSRTVQLAAMQAAKQQLLPQTRLAPAGTSPPRPRSRCGPVMMAAGGTISREVLTRSQRLKLDQSNDRQFYALPRIVKHVDDGFLGQVTQLYRERIPADSVVLDLMSSWVSHLPPEAKYSKVIGHGMNAAELAKNKQLDSFFVRDLNAEPDGWSLPDKSVDAITCCVSIQYMQQPERVFAEMYRVLRPGGVVIITFSNRMFYDKAITAWRDNTGYGRCQLVKQYFQCVEGFTDPEIVLEVPLPKRQQSAGLLGLLPKPLQQFVSKTGQDPFNAVIAYRNFKPDRA